MRPRLACFRFFLFACAAGGALPLAAQSRPKPVCFRGRPADQCRWFLITESRYHLRLAPGVTVDEWGDPGTTYTRHYLLAEAGLMRNLPPTAAVGLTAWGGYDFGYETTRLGLALRGRRWIGRRSSLEGSLGVGYTSDGGRTLTAALGLIAWVDVNLAELLQLGVRVEWMPEAGRCPLAAPGPDGCIEVIPQDGGGIGLDRTEPVRVWRVYLGAGVGSKLGVATWLLAGLGGLGAAIMGPCYRARLPSSTQRLRRLHAHSYSPSCACPVSIATRHHPIASSPRPSARALSPR